MVFLFDLKRKKLNKYILILGKLRKVLGMKKKLLLLIIHFGPNTKSKREKFLILIAYFIYH